MNEPIKVTYDKDYHYSFGPGIIAEGGRFIPHDPPIEDPFLFSKQEFTEIKNIRWYCDNIKKELNIK